MRACSPPSPTGPIVLALAALLLLAGRTPAERDWHLKRTGEELAVYTRDYPGSHVKEVKLVMTVDAAIPAINAILDDASRQPEWVFRCTEARDLGGRVDTGWYYYSRISMPWPMDDRDLAAKVIGGREGEAYVSHSVAAPDRAPEVDDCVRITDFEVSTAYRAVDDARTEVTYQLHSEPGGAVPAWIVNLFIDKGPVETMTKLRSLVERG